MCGEKGMSAVSSSSKTGSPPRVRGEVARQRIHLDAARITPACAGRSSLRVRPRVPAKDHPRVCGEKHKKLVQHPFERGSPPRVRGEVTIKRHIFAIERITPACAGRSLARLF